MEEIAVAREEGHRLTRCGETYGARSPTGSGRVSLADRRQPTGAVLGERAAVLEEAIKRHLGGLLAILPIASGIDATAFLPANSDDAAVARRAVAAGIETRPLSAYAIDVPAPGGLVLGFAPFDKPQIAAGVQRLAEVLDAGPASA